MSNPKYVPVTPETREARLLEEIGEVLKAHGKAKRFGLDTRYSVRLDRVVAEDSAEGRRVESNRDMLVRELLDLQEVTIDYLSDLLYNQRLTQWHSSSRTIRASRKKSRSSTTAHSRKKRASKST